MASAEAMGCQAMTARFTTDPPLASADTWAGRRQRAVNHLREKTTLELIWRRNMARRDQAAKDYGEPSDPHEFYAGRPGARAETTVLDCLRELQSIPQIDRLFASELMDVIAKAYLSTAPDPNTSIRRITQLLKIAAI